MARQQQRGQSKPQLKSASTTLAEAEELLREGRAEDALPIALRALDTLREGASSGQDASPPTAETAAALPALNLVAEIHLELGDAPAARSYFLRAASLDPDGQLPASQGGGAEKFLYLAQLSDQGGQDSVTWFTRGAAILRREISSLSSENNDNDEPQGQEEDGEKRKKLAETLCGIIEVYMTDLSWDPAAETQCEKLISEALLVAPGCAEPLQTLASIRISQGRVAEAKDALRDSMAVWTKEPEEEKEEEEQDEDDDDDESLLSARIPDFATRISLSRLLMEVGMSSEALGVLETLIAEDDGSVEAWYLGGWCLYLLGQKPFNKHDGAAAANNNNNIQNRDRDDEKDLSTHSLLSSREWLTQSLRLYEMVEYEDERLKAHAAELIGEIDGLVGADGVDEEEWNGFGDNSDEEDADEEMGDG